MPRYVILEHDYPVLHWDFMLEAGDVLRTWRLAAPPAPQQTVQATYLSGHRRMYLDYEGPVSGNRGWVTRWDAGTFTWLADEDSGVAVQLDGHRLRGNVLLKHVHDDAWVLTFIVQPRLGEERSSTSRG
jgi:hypothetical protein